MYCFRSKWACEGVGTSNMMKNSSPGSPCTTIFWPSSNWTGSKASATVRRSHLSRDSEGGEKTTAGLSAGDRQTQRRGGGDFCLKQDIFKLSQVILISWRRRDDAPPRLFLSRETWKRANAPKMDTFLRNSSYIFLFLKVLPCRGKTLH